MSRAIEDALHTVPSIASCVAVGIAGAPGEREVPAAAFALAPGAALALDELAAAVAALPEHARPRRLRRVEAIPLTDGFRPLKKPIRDLGFADGPEIWAWNPTTSAYRSTTRAEFRGVPHISSPL